ncbi:ADP-ribosylation_factor 1 [Hexamita inflata]|uniref:ADP-ribosylation factor 1 n=1 Tax=Hexamita inflata TaxID=28002 RepID=A0AA86NVG8_9EUKA|nr:ADP-ribosylation factor 1 [Hexamita inflata]
MQNIFNCLFRRRVLRVVLLGLSGSGKSFLLQSWKNDPQLPTYPTIGFNVVTMERKNATIQFWDVGGDKRLRGLWRFYTTGADSIIFVIDATVRDYKTIVETKFELHTILTNNDLKSTPIIIIFNKNDQVNKMNEEELEEEYQLKAVFQKRKGKTIIVSADFQNGAEEILKCITKGK